MKKYILDLKVVSNERFASGHSLLKLTDESKALPEILPGQFVQVRACAEGGLPLLRRPISVNFVDRKKNELWLLVHNVGVGTAPLLYLGKELLKRDVEPTFLLGGRSARDILQLDDFAKYGRVFITTEDASAGEQGFVTQHSLLEREKFDYIATCGPKPMMKAVAKYASQSGTACEASLENMMACGLGACLCCVEENAEGHNVCVCKEGPIFNINKLSWLN